LIGENIDTDAVIINSTINNKIYEPGNVMLDDISDILYSKFVHKGINLLNNQTVEFDYFHHPVECYNIQTEADFNKYKIHEFTFLGFDLCMVFEIDSDNNINKRATRLLGTHKIAGGVLLVAKSSTEFIDLTLDLYNKMNSLAFGLLSSRLLKDDEKKEENSNAAINKFSVLNERYNSLTDVCHNCNAIFVNDPLTCSGCYRAKYHILECQENDWEEHKKECLYNKDYLNKKI